ncbi:Hypothetical predicted protein [Mytilus galloprovincialis]|uniref:Uncharacterized protein n=1 Tax=Mytilus galloprovincialis TaxID=29158 RepID=A0A8B6GWK3_MYTGA|nr:Hypothetical predicted protein [Mytilus galloprovincialis]
MRRLSLMFINVTNLIKSISVNKSRSNPDYKCNTHDEINNENSAYYQELFNATFIVLTNYYSNSAATKDNFIKIVVYRMSHNEFNIYDWAKSGCCCHHNLVNGGATVTIGFVTAGATKADIYAPGGNATITPSTTICGTFNTWITCPTGQECSIDGNGVPYCAPIESTGKF